MINGEASASDPGVQASTSESSQDLRFKYKYVGPNGAGGMIRRRGGTNEQGLDLGGEFLAYEAIVQTAARDKRLLLRLAPGTPLPSKGAKYLQDGCALVLEISKARVADLKTTIDRVSSARLSEQHRRQLLAEGKGNLFRTMVCPQCEATIDLSGFAATPHTYCPCCESVLQGGDLVVSPGSTCRICDECGMFGRIRSYTILYFYFLLVAYGYSQKRRDLCDGCAVRIGRKTLLANLLFVLGTFWSVAMLIRAVAGRDPRMRGLPEANRPAYKGRYQEADMIYDRLLGEFPGHPGILMNQAMGHLHGDDTEAGMDMMAAALDSCSNYLPALQLMQKVYVSPPA